MGLFDVFKSEPLKLSPRLALAVGLLYMMAADGEIESEEIGLPDCFKRVMNQYMFMCADCKPA